MTTCVVRSPTLTIIRSHQTAQLVHTLLLEGEGDGRKAVRWRGRKGKAGGGIFIKRDQVGLLRNMLSNTANRLNVPKKKRKKETINSLHGSKLPTKHGLTAKISIAVTPLLVIGRRLGTGPWLAYIHIDFFASFSNVCRFQGPVSVQALVIH